MCHVGSGATTASLSHIQFDVAASESTNEIADDVSATTVAPIVTTIIADAPVISDSAVVAADTAAHNTLDTAAATVATAAVAAVADAAVVIAPVVVAPHVPASVAAADSADQSPFSQLVRDYAPHFDFNLQFVADTPSTVGTDSSSALLVCGALSDGTRACMRQETRSIAAAHELSCQRQLANDNSGLFAKLVGACARTVDASALGLVYACDAIGTLRSAAGAINTVKHLPQIALDMASALARVHDLRILNLSLRPQSVLLYRGSGGGAVLRAQLFDFGCAALGADSLCIETPLCDRTFTAPEIFDNTRYKQHGTPADMYSFGATLLEALHGRPIADASELPSLLAQLPPGPWRNLIAKCLEDEPTQRPTARTAVEQIRAWMERNSDTEAPAAA